MTAVRRPSLQLVVGVAAILCIHAPGLHAEDADLDDAGSRSNLPAVTARNLGPGPLPHRRRTAPKRVFSSTLSTESAIEQCVQADMAAIDAPGAAVTVIHRGDVIFDQGFGYKRDGGSDPVDSGTRFRIGSATKMLTAAAVMQQVEAGVVDLDDPVTDWVPELSLAERWSDETITVRHLLTHSSGLPDYFKDVPGPVGNHALTEWAEGLIDLELHAPPGTFWNYSNPNFAMAGLIAERAAGLPYRELMATRVFAAAGMDATTFDPTAVVASGNYSYGHDPQPDGSTTIYAPDDYDSWMGSPSGFVFSTARDLASWALLLMDGGGSVLTPSSTEAMQARHISLEDVPDSHYGFGVFAEIYKGLDIRQHGGNLYGWGAYLMWVPGERFVVSVLGNTTYYLREAAYCILDVVLEPEPTPPPDFSTDPSTWARFTGFYEFMDNTGDFFQTQVKLHDHRFTITFTDRDDPGVPYTTDLVQLHLDTFQIDLDSDPELDFDLTFINRGTPGSPEMWLRNRSFVGYRIPQLNRPNGRRMPN